MNNPAGLALLPRALREVGKATLYSYVLWDWKRSLDKAKEEESRELKKGEY